MKELKLKVKNETGFHARPAAALVGQVSKYNSKITIFKGGKQANLKSILGLLSLGISQNEEVVIRIEGEDEEQAYIEIDRFGKESGLW